MLIRRLAFIVAIAALAASAAAQETAPARGPRVPFPIPAIEAGATVDGAVTEPLWEQALKLELRYEVRPGENTPPPVRTEVFVAHNSTHVFVAFKCYDDDPASIRARFSDRDNTFNDDWVGVVLDTFNDERRAYEFFVNPLGIQADMLQDDVAGNEDSSWNAIWESAGRLTSTGYEVEIAIPFTQLRFQERAGGEPQTWGIDLMRGYPRKDNHQFTLFPRIRGVNTYLGQAEKVTGFAGLRSGQNMEIVPTVTTVRSDARSDVPAGRMENVRGDADFGITGKWGITPNVTLNATVNPDFSQVEADAVQLDVNNQFTLFFSETRPFFLEGADLFVTPRLQLLHTRQIAQPNGALKLTGKIGRHAFGVFAAQDETTAVLLPGPESSQVERLDAHTVASVGRYRFDVGRNSTVGAMMTDRRGGGYFNNVVSIDGRHRFSEADSFSGTVALTTTQDAPSIAALTSERQRSSIGTELLFGHSVRTWDFGLEYGQRDRDFRSDLGFITQVDYRRWEVSGGRTWHGTSSTFYNRINVNANVDQTERIDRGLLEREYEAYISMNGRRESYVQYGGGTRTVVFNGVRFDQTFQSAYFEVRPSAAIEFGTSVNWGDAIDFQHTRAGDSYNIRPFVNLNYGRHLSARYGHIFNALRVDGGQLFSAQVPELRVVYQHDARTLFRAILQYTGVARDQDLYESVVDLESRELFAQLLFSYKINAQTALYLGYVTGAEGTERFALTPSNRTLFAKFSYAWLR